MLHSRDVKKKKGGGGGERTDHGDVMRAIGDTLTK